jgi:AcrR family transcriptional regulator
MNARERIIEHASMLFLKEGVKKVTMDELAIELGMSKRTIYENFSNKDELISCCVKHQISAQNAIGKRIEMESKTAMHVFLNLLEIGLEHMKSSKPQFALEVRKYYPKIWASTLAANSEQKLMNTSKLLERGVNERVFRSDVKVAIAAKLLLEYFSLLFDQDAFPPHIYPPAEIFNTMIIGFIRGIASNDGLEIIDDFLKNRSFN